MSEAASAASPERTCATCGAPRTGPYCARCGQRELPARHTLRGLALGALRRVVGEEGALATAWQLTVRPGRVVRDYLAGRTVRYVHPVAYLLLAAAVFVLVGRALGEATGAAESDRLFVLLVIPFVAAASRLLFWKGPYNYAEHLIAVLFLAAHGVLVLAALYIGLRLVPRDLLGAYTLASLAVALGYFAWGYSRIFERRRWLAALAGLLALGAGAAVWLGFLLVLVRLLRR